MKLPSLKNIIAAAKSEDGLMSYLSTVGSNKEISFVSVYDKEKVSLSFEMTVLPETNLKNFSEFAFPNLIEHCLAEKKTYVIENAVVCHGIGLAETSDRKIISETAFNPAMFENIEKRRELRLHPHSETLKGFYTSISCGWYGGYYHWLIDSLPRLFALHKAEFLNIPRIFLLHPPIVKSEEKLFLKALLPDNVELREIKGNRPYRVENFISLPALSGDCVGYLPKEYLSFFRDRIFETFKLKSNDSKKKNILVSRKFASKRRWLNDEEITITLAREFGFETYYLEKLSLAEQVELFSQAEFVVAQHGAGLTNLLFANDCSILELHTGRILNHYRWLSHSLNLTYGNILINEGEKDDNVFIKPAGIVEKVRSMIQRNHK